MARFYDTASDLELDRIEALLTNHGIGYRLNQVAGTIPALQEFIVAEEDLVFAEQLLCECNALAD